jgi:hypothetical protein
VEISGDLAGGRGGVKQSGDLVIGKHLAQKCTMIGTMIGCKLTSIDQGFGKD